MKKLIAVLLILSMACMFAACVSTVAESGASSAVESEESRPAPLWGDNLGGRNVYTNADVESGVLGDSITLNSVIDSPIRDARFFIWAKAAGSSELEDSTTNVIQVEDGETYEIWMYVQNDNPGAVVEGLRAAISVPTMSTGQVCQISGFFHSDNAVATKIWSTVLLTGEQGFALDYVFGKAKLINAAHPDGLSLNDEIVTKAASERGVLIGYDELNGKLPGGSDYGTYVVIRVKVEYLEPAPMNVRSRARADDTSEWQETLKGVQVGDELTYRVEYQNASAGVEKNVLGRFWLDGGLEYISGSARLINAECPDGASLDDSFLLNYTNIGNYDVGANAIVEFSVRVTEKPPKNGVAIRSEFSCRDTIAGSSVTMMK